MPKNSPWRLWIYRLEYIPSCPNFVPNLLSFHPKLSQAIPSCPKRSRANPKRSQANPKPSHGIPSNPKASQVVPCWSQGIPSCPKAFKQGLIRIYTDFSSLSYFCPRFTFISNEPTICPRINHPKQVLNYPSLIPNLHLFHPKLSQAIPNHPTQNPKLSQTIPSYHTLELMSVSHFFASQGFLSTKTRHIPLVVDEAPSILSVHKIHQSQEGDVDDIR
jgi:hypothetical protein